MSKKRVSQTPLGAGEAESPEERSRSFGRMMRSWRQSGSPAERELMWALLERFADAVVCPFYSERHRPSAFHEAVCSGSVEAIDLAARAAGPGLALGLSQPDFGQMGAGGHGADSFIGSAWLGADQSPDGSCAAVTRRLLELGADPEGLRPWPGRPLVMAVAMGDLGAAAALIAAGADASRVSSDGSSLLRVAVARNEDASRMWALLIEAGADPLVLDAEGRTPWEAASPAQGGWLSALRERGELAGESGAGVGGAPAPRRL